MRAIILAAGKGTRLNSALPKPLHHIGGRPMLAWSLDAAKAAAASQIVTVLPKGSDAIINWLDGQKSCIQDPPKGSGGKPYYNGTAKGVRRDHQMA